MVREPAHRRDARGGCALSRIYPTFACDPRAGSAPFADAHIREAIATAEPRRYNVECIFGVRAARGLENAANMTLSALLSLDITYTLYPPGAVACVQARGVRHDG
jgi:hypothetical protein